MIEQEFRNKYAGKVVHCDTEEKAKEFLKLADSFGYAWTTTRGLLNRDNWEDYKDETCYRVRLNDEISFSSRTFYISKGIEIIEFESEEKRKTKKVFDLGLFVNWSIKNGRSYVATSEDIDLWAWKSHGKTKKEIWDNNTVVTDEWMKEVEVKPELSEKEIEVLKALKVLDFKWIARDENNLLYAYTSELKPFKMSSYYYFNGGDNIMLKEDLFTFITWQDEEATSIKELLCGLQ